MTNFEQYASTPEKVADLLIQFNPNMRTKRPALKSFERFMNNDIGIACMRTDTRSLLIDWLREDCGD